MMFMAFWGEERVPDGVSAHESASGFLRHCAFWRPSAIGAGYFGVHIHGGGFLGFLEPHGAIHHFLEPVTRAPSQPMHTERMKQKPPTVSSPRSPIIG
ncbi:MAG: hypothetical protein R3E58_18930 [Phycisphaerae bacterium]